jgi:hypothetical protein
VEFWRRLESGVANLGQRLAGSRMVHRRKRQVGIGLELQQKHEFVFRINEPIDIIVTGNEIEGNISGKSLKNGVNSIKFQSESVIDYYGLSFMMDSIEIKPIDSKNSHFMDSKNPC